MKSPSINYVARFSRFDRTQSALEISNSLRALIPMGEFQWLALLVVGYGMVYLLGAVEFYDILNVAGPIALMIILGRSCYQIVRRSAVAIWAPLFWFRAASGVYFGLGALVPHVLDYETGEAIRRLYFFDAAVNLKVNLITALGILLTLVFSYFFLSRSNGSYLQKLNGEAGKKESRTLFVSAFFLLAGGAVRYGYEMPHEFGLHHYVMPGALGAIGKTYYVGIYLMLVHAVGENRRFLPLAMMLVGLEVLVSLASFAKTDLMMILIFSFLGLLSVKATRKRLLIGSCIILSSFILFQPLVRHGRSVLEMRYGEIRGAGLQERLDIIQAYLVNDQMAERGSAQISGMARLSYLNVNAFVVDRYDAGQPGNTLRDGFAVFVPRMLWPDKPIITRLGGDLYYLASGRYGSSLGVGHFAEAYWNFGWLGIAPFMFVLAGILAIFTRISVSVMANKNWIMLPIVFFGVQMGFRVDGHFVPDIVGAGWTALILGLLLYCSKSLFQGLIVQRSH